MRALKVAFDALRAQHAAVEWKILPGSNPITYLSLTFSWIPHCCPQKQQCVRTSRSGSPSSRGVRRHHAQVRAEALGNLQIICGAC